MGNQATVFTSTVWHNGSALFVALVKGLDGANLSPDNISAITYTVYAMGKNASDSYDPVEGHEDEELDVDLVMFEPTTKTYNGEQKQVNFEWRIDNSEYQPFPERNCMYQVVINFYPYSGGGYISPLVFQLSAV